MSPSKASFDSVLGSIFKNLWISSGKGSCSLFLFNIALISSSVCLTVSFSEIILLSKFLCISASGKDSKLLACLSDILLYKSAFWTSFGKFKSLILFAIEDWLTPSLEAISSWVNPLSISFLYDCASSITDKFFLCKFSSNAISALVLSSVLFIIAGTFFNPAKHEALYLLSPAIISYLSPIFLSTIGWITPYLIIELASSFNSFSSKASLGWNLLGIISSIGI